MDFDSLHYFTLMIVSSFLFLIYMVLAFQLIICRLSTFDRFTIILTFSGIIGMILNTGSAITTWFVIDDKDK